jgi:hypothetical protein
VPAIEDLPGAELVLQGLADLREGRWPTVGALLVAIARPRLLALGLDVPSIPEQAAEHELALYRELRAAGSGDAYSRYNSLLRRLVSFEQALEQRVYRQLRQSGHLELGGCG